MNTIFILTSTLSGKDTNLIAASPDKESLREQMKQQIKDYLADPDQWDDNDPCGVRRREELRRSVESATDHWDDGEEGYLLEYDITEVALISRPDRPLPPPTARQAVTEQLIAMLQNNILQEYGPESFTGWCEDGDVFHTDGYDDMPADTKDDAIFIMKEAAPHVDALTELLTEKPEN